MPEDRNSSHDMVRAFRQLRHVNWGGKRPLDGCTPSETMMLFCIRRGMKAGSPGLKAAEISQMMQITSPTVTQTINMLEAKGLVERSPDPTDRRVARIKLTVEGEQITQMAEDSMHIRVQGLIDHLGKERSLLLVELLDEVVHYLGEKEPHSCSGRERMPLNPTTSEKEGE